MEGNSRFRMEENGKGGKRWAWQALTSSRSRSFYFLLSDEELWRVSEQQSDNVRLGFENDPSGLVRTRLSQAPRSRLKGRHF